MNVLFENEHFIALDKPAGWLSVVSRDKDDPRPCLATQLQAKSAGQNRIWPCHRLDVEVSGLILFAKNSEAHRAANKWFEDHTIQKIYEALTELPVERESRAKLEAALNKSVTWRSIIARGKKRAYESAHGKEAITHAELLEIDGTLSDGTRFWHWHLKPQTGRPHQLRFELFKRQMPVIGDKLYSSNVSFTMSGIALRSIALSFEKIDAKAWGLPPMLEAPPFSI